MNNQEMHDKIGFWLEHFYKDLYIVVKYENENSLTFISKIKRGATIRLRGNFRIIGFYVQIYDKEVFIAKDKATITLINPANMEIFKL